MFYPNCGKNCGDAKFCVSCGAKVQQAARAAHWHIGMPCPNCGGNKLDGKYCAFCGTQLLLEVPGAPKSTAKNPMGIPLGTYEGSNGELRLEENGVVIRRHWKKKHFAIKNPYAYLTTLLYFRPSSDNEFGHLLIRWTGNSHFPLPPYSDLENDGTTISFDASKEIVFYHIFCMLRAIAPSTAQCSICADDGNEAKIEMTDSQVDLMLYFNKFAPYRHLAANALACDTGISINSSRLLIDCCFDHQQQILYEKDPALSIQDLTKIISMNPH